MIKMPLRLVAAAAILSLPAAASAHRQWMLPNATIFSGTESWVTVDIAASNDLFFLDHQPGRLEGIKVWQPDGTPGQIQNGATGRYRSVFDVKLDKPGTWKIGSEQSGVMGSFKVNGEEKRVGGRSRPGGPKPLTVADIPANATDVKLTETIGRNEIYVTAGEPSTTVFTPTGRGIEFSPVTHPDELVSGEPAKLRFLVDGKPAAGLKITAIPGGKRYRDAENEIEVTTGADGVANLTFPSAGMWWINTTLADNKPSTPRATDRRLSYTSTMEVMAP